MADKKRNGVPARKTAVLLDGHLRQRLRLYVARSDLKIKAILNEALDEYLKKRGA
jgi:hypothetical protein